MPQTDHADTLALILRTAEDIPEPEREYKFCAWRKWRADFAYPDYKLLVEVDGGQWKPGGGRHGGDADRAKTNTAACLGYRVLHFSPAMLNDPDGVLRVIRAALEIP